MSTDILAVASVQDFKWRQVNPMFHQIFGWHEVDISTISLFEMVHPEDLGRFRLLGLATLIERARAIGGMLDIDSALGKGCRISLRIQTRLA